MAHLTVEIIPDYNLGGFTARIPELPVSGDGVTEEEAVDDLKMAIRGYVEQFGIEDAMAKIRRPEIPPDPD